MVEPDAIVLPSHIEHFRKSPLFIHNIFFQVSCRYVMYIKDNDLYLATLMKIVILREL